MPDPRSLYQADPTQSSSPAMRTPEQLIRQHGVQKFYEAERLAAAEELADLEDSVRQLSDPSRSDDLRWGKWDYAYPGRLGYAPRLARRPDGSHYVPLSRAFLDPWFGMGDDKPWEKGPDATPFPREDHNRYKADPSGQSPPTRLERLPGFTQIFLDDLGLLG